MYIYYLVFICLNLFVFKDLLKPTVFTKYFLNFTLVLILICFVGFRYNADVDYDDYVRIFDNTPIPFFNIRLLINHCLRYGFEFGYIFVSSILRTFGFGAQSIFFLSASISFIFLYNASKRMIRYPAIALVGLFTQYFTLLFVQMRFGIATSIGLYACSLLMTQKRKQFWMFLVLASMFHLSALGIAAVYFFYKIDWLKRKNIFIVSCLSVFTALIPIRFLLEKLLTITGIHKYTAYLKSTESSLLSLLFVLILIIPLIIFGDNLRRRQVNVNLFLSMAFAGIFIGATFWRLEVLARFSLINLTVLSFIIPSYLLLLKSLSMKVICYFIIVFYSFLKFLPNMRWVSGYSMFIGFNS